MNKKKVRKSLLAVLLAFAMFIGNILPVFAEGNIQINKDSITIKSDESYQLQVTVNGIEQNAAWGSSDSSVAVVDNTGLVTGKAAGSAVITAMVNGSTVECLVTVLKKTTNSTSRYNVLILDASGSMKGTPASGQKTAAKRFCQKVLSTEGNNYVAVVALNSSPVVVQGFTDNYSVLNQRISSITVNGHTNMNSALSIADNLLNSVNKSGTVFKNIVLCSDGLPTVGKLTSSGRYSSGDHKWYGYANASYNIAKVSKYKGYFVYALGFFHNSKGNDLKFGKRLMKDLASKDKYFIIQDSSDLDHVFDNIADNITKTTINKTSLTLTAGSSYQLNAMVNGVTKTAIWSSSDSLVASVNSKGKVTAKMVGTTTITAELNDASVTCVVTVKPKITLNKTKATIYTGEKLKLKATVKGSNSAVKWKSSNSSLASVSSSGVVEAKKAGKVTISASVEGVTAKCIVTVKKATHPVYSTYFTFKPTSYRKGYSTITIDEQGIRIVVNDDAVIEKCAVYLYKSGSYYYRTIAFKGENVTSARISAYVAYKGKVLDDGISSSDLNSWAMRKDSNGIWSNAGRFDTSKANVTNASGQLLSNIRTGIQSSNTKVFSDLNKMKKWLAQ